MKKLSLSLVVTVFTLSLFAFNLSRTHVLAADKILEDTLGNRIKVNSSSFIFNANYGYTEFEKPVKINVKVNGSNWLAITNFEDSMSQMGFVAIASKGCSSSDLPTYEAFTIQMPDRWLGPGQYTYKDVSVLGYKSSSVKYEVVYADGTSMTVNATEPVLFSDDTDYLHTDAKVKSYCGIVDPTPTPTPTPTPVPTPTPTPTPTPVPEPEPEVKIYSFENINKDQGNLQVEFSLGYDATLQDVDKFSISSKDGSGMIMFTNGGDLSSEEVVNKLNNLEQYFTFGQNFVEFDSENFSEINGMAVISLYGLDFDKTPKILVNGNEDTEGIVTDVNYNVEEGYIEFTVAHFTRFEVVEDDSTSVVRKVNYIRDTTWSEQTVYLVLGGGLIISTLVGLGVFILGKKVYNRIRIKRHNKTDLSDATEENMEKEMVEEVKEEIEEIRDITA